jgi:5-methylthioadenosine/S-adenosylhomocysteine deaminase
MVDGSIVAEHGVVTSVDEAALLDEARDHFAAKRPALQRSNASAERLVPMYQAMVRKAASIDVGMSRWVGPA